MSFHQTYASITLTFTAIEISGTHPNTWSWTFLSMTPDTFTPQTTHFALNPYGNRFGGAPNWNVPYYPNYPATTPPQYCDVYDGGYTVNGAASYLLNEVSWSSGIQAALGGWSLCMQIGFQTDYLVLPTDDPTNAPYFGAAFFQYIIANSQAPGGPSIQQQYFQDVQEILTGPLSSFQTQYQELAFGQYRDTTNGCVNTILQLNPYLPYYPGTLPTNTNMPFWQWFGFGNLVWTFGNIDFSESPAVANFGPVEGTAGCVVSITSATSTDDFPAIPAAYTLLYDYSGNESKHPLNTVADDQDSIYGLYRCAYRLAWTEPILTHHALTPHYAYPTHPQALIAQHALPTHCAMSTRHALL